MERKLKKDGSIKGRGKDYWQKTLQDWKASGLSPTKYCALKDLGESAFYKWKALLGFKSKKLKEAKNGMAMSIKKASKNNQMAPFVEFNLGLAVHKNLPTHIDLILKNGLQLRLSCLGHELGLGQLIKTLEALPC